VLRCYKQVMYTRQVSSQSDQRLPRNFQKTILCLSKKKLYTD